MRAVPSEAREGVGCTGVAGHCELLGTESHPPEDQRVLLTSDSLTSPRGHGLILMSTARSSTARFLSSYFASVLLDCETS